jgi:class 3 adenylate cyclase
MARVSDPPTLESASRAAELHGPVEWANEIAPEALHAAMAQGERVNAIVLAADIRASTLLMREAVSPLLFADAITEFVDAVRDALRGQRGWFDKFTGDGFLAYWLYCDRAPQSYVAEVAHVSNVILTFFRDVVIEELRKNTRAFVPRTGLSLGIDGGPVSLVSVARDLTVIGSPVVGAVRMVTAAEPYETLVNGYLGTALYNDRCENERLYRIKTERLIRKTKEYEGGQEVYRITFENPLTGSR